MLQAAKRQSQAAGKALARSQSAFSGWRSICRKWWKCCDWCRPGKRLNLLKGPTGSNILAQVKRHRTPQTDLFLNRSYFTAAILTRNCLYAVQFAKFTGVNWQAEPFKWVTNHKSSICASSFFWPDWNRIFFCTIKKIKLTSVFKLKWRE